MKLNIRDIREEDMDRITGLFLETYSREPWNETWEPGFAKKRIEDLVKCNISQNYCLENEEKELAGVLLGRRNYYLDKKELFIDEFFIIPKYQGKGIGSVFMTMVAERIRESGYSYIILNTEKDFPSERFYRRYGFRQKENTLFMYMELQR